MYMHVARQASTKHARLGRGLSITSVLLYAPVLSCTAGSQIAASRSSEPEGIHRSIAYFDLRLLGTTSATADLVSSALSVKTCLPSSVREHGSYAHRTVCSNGTTDIHGPNKPVSGFVWDVSSIARPYCGSENRQCIDKAYDSQVRPLPG